MPCYFVLKTDEDNLIATIEGSVSSIDELFAFDQDILEEAKKLGLRKMLRDVRKVNFRNIFYDDVISFMEKRLSLTDRSKRFVVAIVVGDQDRELGKMFETAARTRSFTLQSFLDYDEAIAWLKTFPAS